MVNATLEQENKPLIAPVSNILLATSTAEKLRSFSRIY